MEQLVLEIRDYGWFATLPFSSLGQAKDYEPFFRSTWEEVEIKYKGNG